MKLIIQIPCKNEEAQLPITFAELPTSIPWIDCIETLVIDDGSTDRTADVAKELGVTHVISFRKNRWLGNAFKAGVQFSLLQWADIVVNTDADNQYPWRYITDLVQPILDKKADIVIGDRQPTRVQHFHRLKKNSND